MISGSSPLARGTYRRAAQLVGRERLIPARAGNMRGTSHGEYWQAAHPRSRGEHLISASV